MRIYIVLGPFAVGYLFSYLFRAVNAVVAPNLVDEIGLTAAQLGLLTSAYLIAFAAFQLPLGILLDRFGPRRVQVVLLCLAAAGAACFALGQSAWTLTLARALIGLGFAGGLMSGLNAVVLWVPQDRRAFANACIMSAGALGVMVATVPMELAVQMFGWRAVFWGLAAMTLAVSLLVWVIVPDPRREGAPEGLKTQIHGLGQILVSPVFWRIVPVASLTAGFHIALQTLWAGPWFRDVSGLDRDGVALMLLTAAGGFFVGILASGAVADWLGRRGISSLTFLAYLFPIYMAIQLVMILEIPGTETVSWILFGMLGQASIIAYPWLAAYFGPGRAGRAHTAINLGIFVGASALQYLIGVIIDQFEPLADGGYDPIAYKTAFSVFLAAQFVAFIWFVTGRLTRLA